MSTTLTERKKTTILSIQKKKNTGTPITMLTAYDYSSAILVDNSGVDAILVGDSLGMVMLGHETTIPVSMDDMLHHCKAVAKGAKSALLIGDMPFLSYQINKEEAIRNAGRFLQEGGMDAVKLEGGSSRADTIKEIVAAGIPVMGHIGLTPQSVNQLGGYRTQGTTAKAALKLVEDAIILQDAGCFSIVLEKVPSRLANLISNRLTIPTIGIGAGGNCDGQVLVYHDLLGLFDRPKLKFVKIYADLYPIILNALTEYLNDVENRAFPAQEHDSVDLSDDEWNSLNTSLSDRE